MMSHIHGQFFRRLTVILAVTGTLAVAAAAPALAAAPSNDDISNATVITNLPFHDVVPDVTQATFNPATDQSSCGGRDQSVWYQFTPTTSEPIAFDVNPSTDFLAIDVFTGSPGALNFVGCGTGGQDGNDGQSFEFNAAAGTTYWIMVSSGCCISSGNIDLSVYPAVPPQATISVDDSGAIDHGGNAAITGTLDCTGTVPSGLSVTGTVRQSVGHLNSVTANFTTTVACGTHLTWAALAQPTAGKFTGGAVTVNVAVFGCNLVGCAQPSTTSMIKLKG